MFLLKLKDSGIYFDKDLVKSKDTEFYETSRYYLEQWTGYFTKELKLLFWADLKEVPEWKDTQNALDVLIEKGYTESYKDSRDI